jgi:hypothetical protein
LRSSGARILAYLLEDNSPGTGSFVAGSLRDLDLCLLKL